MAYLTMNGLGQGAASPDEVELAKIRAEKKQVEAEILRLQAGAVTRVGGFRIKTPAQKFAEVATAQRHAAAVAAQAAVAKRARQRSLIGYAAVGGLALFGLMLWRRKR